MGMKLLNSKMQRVWLLLEKLRRDLNKQRSHAKCRQEERESGNKISTIM